MFDKSSSRVSCVSWFPVTRIPVVSAVVDTRDIFVLLVSRGSRVTRLTLSFCTVVYRFGCVMVFTSSCFPVFTLFFTHRFFEQMCTDIYGERFTHDLLDLGVKRTNTMFGGFNMKSRRIVFPNGSVDPWHALGITSSREVSSDSMAVFINGTAHCADLYPDSESDPPSLIDARIQIRNFLASSLSQRDWRFEARKEHTQEMETKREREREAVKNWA